MENHRCYPPKKDIQMKNVNATISIDRAGRLYDCTLWVSGMAAEEIKHYVPMPPEYEVVDAQAWANLKNMQNVQLAWVYREKLTIAHEYSDLRIRTLMDSGRGQTAVFDDLVGERIAAIRKEMGRKLATDGGNEMQEISLTPAEIERLIHKIDATVIDDPQPKFALFGGKG